MVTNMLLFIILAPIVIGIIGLCLPNLWKKVCGVLVLVGNLYFAVLLLTQPPVQTSFLSIDALSRLIILFISILGLLIFIYAWRNVSSAYEGKSLLLILLSIGFSNGAVASGQMVSFIIFWGVSGLFLYFYGLLSSPAGADAAKKTFLMIGASDVCLIFGLALLWSNNHQSFALYTSVLKITDFWSCLAFFSLFSAALTKAGGFPMHTWVPVFCESAPIEGVALLPAALDKLLGIYLLARLMTKIFIIPFLLNATVMMIGALTIIIAVMMALIQHNGRKLLGYHAVSQVGYMVLGLGTGNPIGIIGGLFHLINHAIYKSNLFLAFGSVEKRTGTAELDRISGLATLMPWTFISSLVGALAISGLPPFNGFVSKWLIYQSLIVGAHAKPVGIQFIYIFCLIIAVFGSGLTLASFMKFLYTVYFGKSRVEMGQVREISSNNWLVTITLAAFCLILGVGAFPLVLKGLLGSVLNQSINLATLPGFYQPAQMFYLLLVGVVVAFLGYLIFRRVRLDQNYIGGQEDTDNFTIDGTHFYDEIRLMPPLRTIYDLALKKAFDLYYWVGKLVQNTGLFFQKMHTGVLPTYIIWVLVGFSLVILMLLGFR